MAVLKNLQIYTIPSTGNTYNLSTTGVIEEYIFYGGGTMTGNIIINPTGNNTIGLTFIIKWLGVADLVTNSRTFNVFGVNLTDQQALNKQTIICTYNGTLYDVEIHSNFEDSFIVENKNINLLAVDTPQIKALAVTTTKIDNNAVTTAKILDANVLTTKIADLNVTTNKIAALAVTDAKLATMTNSSLKYGNATGIVGNLALANNEVAIGNGTTIVAVNKSTFNSLPGSYEVINLEVSFEAGEVGASRRIYFPYSCTISKIKTSITKNIAATDDASIIITDDGSATVISTTVIPSSTTVAAASIVVSPAYVYTTASVTSTITITTTKITAGGKAFISISVIRT